MDKDDEIPKTYQPQLSEERWLAFWENEGFFQASTSSKKPAYCIAMPPPNVTGVLHMGHALVQTLQDVLIRYKRMDGFEVLWVPGTDHAGIATQTVVERHLMKKEGKRRQDYTRTEFLEHVFAWKEQSERQILDQIKKLGCSCDWSRLAFTMDLTRSRAVRAVFKKMFDEGLIYRGDYLVNWDPITQTALADDEVEYEERSSSLWYIAYSIQETKEKVVVATTRPETLLGDTALAVSQHDERYRHLVGKTAMIPLIGREIPIIMDHRIDATFGTGVVKVTPAHDPLDYELAKTHHLPIINILTPDGKICKEMGPFSGLCVEEARQSVVAALKETGALIKIEPHHHRVGISYRSKAVIEPYLSKQWFVAMTPFKEKLKKAISSKAVQLVPASWDQTYFHWIDNLRDWCISRQLWWGHQIPIWYRKDDPQIMICQGDEELPEAIAREKEAWVQDEDVLDTWFSSALWPFSILGWPDATEDLKTFYPNSVLVTGHDILFFWVARMLLMGEYVLGQLPFHHVNLQGLIYGRSYWSYDKNGMLTYVCAKDKQAYDLGAPLPKEVHSKWEKMSKSKGNVIDPMEIIALYGVDATRFGLCASAISARQIDLDRRKFEEFKNFLNKIWNGARFVFMNIQTLSMSQLSQGLDQDLDLEDRWILSQLSATIASVRDSLDHFNFDKASMTAYTFFWDAFCAYYVEIVKPILFGKEGTPSQKEMKQKILTIILIQAVRLMHPMAPFITEEIFHRVKTHFGDIPQYPKRDPLTQDLFTALQARSCCVAPYPRLLFHPDEEAKTTFPLLQEVIHAIRNIRGQMQLNPGVSTDLLVIAPPTSALRQILEKTTRILTASIRLHNISFVSHDASSSGSFTFVQDVKLFVPLPNEFIEKERIRLTKEKEKLILQANTLRAQLANPDFLARAPQALIEKLQLNLKTIDTSLIEIASKLQ